jgi:hypothetical protein
METAYDSHVVITNTVCKRPFEGCVCVSLEDQFVNLPNAAGNSARMVSICIFTILIRPKISFLALKGFVYKRHDVVDIYTPEVVSSYALRVEICSNAGKSTRSHGSKRSTAVE